MRSVLWHGPSIFAGILALALHVTVILALGLAVREGRHVDARQRESKPRTMPVELIRVPSTQPASLPPPIAPDEVAPRFPPRFRPVRRPALEAATAPARDQDVPLRALNLRVPSCLEDPGPEGAERTCPDWRAEAFQRPNQDSEALEAAAVAPGWLRPKAPANSGQTALSQGTDFSAPELRGLIFRDAPFPPDPPPQAAE